VTGSGSIAQIFQRKTTGATEIDLLLPDNAVVADAAQGMLATLTAATITMGAAGDLAHVHLMANLRGHAQHVAHNHLPFRSMGFDASPVNVMGNDVGRFMGNYLGEKFLRVLL